MAVYGKQADVIANQGRGVNLYIPGKTILKQGDVFLGGIGTGIGDDQLNGATRVFGNTAEDTASAYGGYLKGSQSQASRPILQPAFKLPPGARPTLAMRSQIAGEDQFNRNYDMQQQQNQFSNGITEAQLMGQYNGADTLQQKTFDWGKAKDEADRKINIGQMMGTYEGNDTLAKQAQAIQDAQFRASQAQNESQFGRSLSSNENQFTRSLGIQQQNANTSAGIYPNTSTSQYASVINKYSDQYGVPANLIDAVIGQESGGNSGGPDSSAGAQGLMQLMPETARSLGVTDPYSVDQNIMGGVKYLSQQLSKYGSNELALAAYNAGPGAVDNAIRNAGSTNWAAVSQYLPTETQNYVPSILGKVKSNNQGAGKQTAAQRTDAATSDAMDVLNALANQHKTKTEIMQFLNDNSGRFEGAGVNTNTLRAWADKTFQWDR